MRLIITAISIFAILLVVAVIGPSFVDWNKYKPQIIAQISNATGLKVTIDGDLGLGVFPKPHVTVNDLTIASPKKNQFENILVMKSADVSVQLMPLLQKQVKIDSVKLVKPIIQVEMLPDGTPSWTIQKLEDAKKIAEAAPEQMIESANTVKNNALDSISLESLEIEDGTFVFYDHKTKAKNTAEEVNLVLKADSLKGPFDLQGGLKIDGKKVVVDAETGKLPTGDEGLSIQAELGLPEADSSVKFGGVAGIRAPYDVQGKTTLKVGSPKDLAAMFGAVLSGQYDQSLLLDGLLSADQNSITYNDLKLSYGDFIGDGKISIQNLQSKNPLGITADIKSSSVLDLDRLMGGAKKPAKTSDENLKSTAKGEAAQKGFVPQTLTLPMPIDASMKIDLAGVKFQGKDIKGVFVDLQKSGNTSKVMFKALELPGQGKADGTLNIGYASSSRSPNTGQVVYSDPTVSYQINGQTGQLGTFLKAFAPDADTSAVTKLYKTAQFNLKGSVNANTISLKDSTLKLGEMVIGLGGRYQPAMNGGRAKAVIDLTAGSVDLDQMMAAQNGDKKTANSAAGSIGASKGNANAKDALKPLKEFSLPLDLIFDVSLQKARINNADLEGLRLTGDMTGKKLTLKTAAVNNFAGAALNLKGVVADISQLSGMDVTFYTKTSDVGRLAEALKVDISKLPKGLKAVEANVSGKGSIDALLFGANVSALGGNIDAAGNAKDILGTPAFDDLSVRIKHPNMVQAIQIVTPTYKGSAALQKPIDFYSKVNSSGKVYDLSDMKVSFGQTDFGGNLKIDTGAKVMSVRGNIAAGKIAVDDLLGAKTGAKASGGGTATSASAKSSGGRWSTDPIDLSFMNTVDVDVNLSASSITYGKWNFTQPSTDLKIGGGQMTVNGLKAGVFGGQATLNTNVKASPVSLTMSSDMNNIDLEKLVSALSGGNKLKSSGMVSFDLDVNSTGGSANALINALNGKANLNGTDVTLKGFDLAKLARGLATDEKLITSATSLIDGAMSGGQTKFDTVKGDYKINNGIVVIQSMAMDSPEVIIESTGSADLPKWFINVDNKITLKNVTDLEPFIVKIKGPIDNPGDTFGKNILEDYIGAKIKRKVGKELGDKLPGILGEDATNALQQFGILPKAAPKVAPTPTPAPEPTPTNDNVAPTSQGTTTPEAQPVAPAEPAPAPAPEPKKIEKPEDAINELLKGGNPEDAINNVIKGLF